MHNSIPRFPNLVFFFPWFRVVGNVGMDGPEAIDTLWTCPSPARGDNLRQGNTTPFPVLLLYPLAIVAG